MGLAVVVRLTTNRLNDFVSTYRSRSKAIRRSQPAMTGQDVQDRHDGQDGQAGQDGHDGH